LRPLTQEIAAINEPDTVPFDIPTGPHCSPESIQQFQELLRVAIRAHFLTTDEILEIILDRIIEFWAPKLESEEFGKVTEVIHTGFGVAVMLLEPDPATDDFLKRTVAALTRIRRRRSTNG